MDISEESSALHYKLRGKLEVVSRYPIQTQKDLSLAYTPGVAAPCLEIQKESAQVLSSSPGRWNTGGSHHRRHSGAGPGRHRPRGRHAGDGGQVRPLQGVRRRGRHPPVRATPRMWTRSWTPSPGSAGSFGGINLEDIAAPRLLRDRAQAERALRHPRSSTTTSTAPPW